MRHVIHIIDRQTNEGTLVLTPCRQTFLVASGEVEPWQQLDDEGPNRWCPHCLAALRAERSGEPQPDAGLHPDLGPSEADEEASELEGDGEFGELEEEYGPDGGVGTPT